MAALIFDKNKLLPTILTLCMENTTGNTKLAIEMKDQSK
jgi:hypothetical protein